MLLTVDQFKRCFPSNKQPEVFTEALNNILPKWGIDTVSHLIHFLAQCGVESQGFTHMVENLNYSAQGLANTWPNRYAVDSKAPVKVPNALAISLQRNPEAIANNCYANRLGNGDAASGDGWTFRGHGGLQLTGRELVTAFAKSIDKTVEETIEYLKTPEGAIEGSCYFWTKYKNVPAKVASGSVKEITKAVNGGLNGLAERYQLTEHIAAVFA